MRMGELPNVAAGQRDAFHVPAVAAWSDGPLRPGESVLFLNDGLTRCVACAEAEREGVADPLRKGVIPPGTVVWVVLDNDLVPGTLTHNFEVKRRSRSVPFTPLTPVAPVTMEVPDPPADPNTVTMEAVPARAAQPAPPAAPASDNSDDEYRDDDDDELNCNVRPPCV